MFTSKRNPRNAIAAAAATMLMAFGAVAQAADASSGITREHVRNELAEARTLGLMDQGGEAGATDRVLMAREMYNQTQTRVILAQMELDQRMQAEAQAAAAQQALADEQAAYVEAGKEGPLLVVVSIDADGSVVDTYTAPLHVLALDAK